MHPPLSKHPSLAEPRLRVSLTVILVSMALAALAGCGFSGSSAAIPAPVALRGTVHGGQQPVTGAKVQLYAAGTTGIGSAALPLLNHPVDSDNQGNFSIPATYDCPSASSQLYLVARGGNPGLAAGADNPAIALTAMIGSCGSLNASSPIAVNEVTTIGSVWPLAAYIKSTTELGYAAGDPAFSPAAATVNQFINIAQGSSPGAATPDSYFAQSDKLYSLADVLDKCVNSSGGTAGDGSPCGALFSMAASSGGSAPTDTMTAAMRVAQNPYNEVSGIYGLTQAPAAFQPALTAAPADWTLQLSHPVATPVLSLATGSYADNQIVTIADATAGAKIYYTIDGSTPTSASSPYAGPFSVNVTTTVQAIAVEGISQSAVAASTLTIAPATVAQVAAKLAFLQQPANTVAGSAIAPAVRVVVQDANGNTVASATNLVRVNLAGVYGLGGTLEIAARNGVATFSNLSESTAGTYTLAASSPGLTSAFSTSFTIIAPPVASVAAKLVFLQQPSNTVEGAIMAPAVRVALEDAGGNVVTSANNPVTLALTGGSGLTGTLTITPLDGVGTFSSLTLNTPGTYTLTASSPALASEVSTQFTITAVPVASSAAKLAFLQQPSNASVGVPMVPTVRVALEDANDNIVTTANNPVTMTLTGVDGLTGMLSVSPVNGVASFSNLAVLTAGTGYTLSATSPGLISTNSTAFTISASVNARPVQAKSADSFVDAVGLNVHFGYLGSIYTSQTAQLLSYLGHLHVRHLRDQMFTLESSSANTLFSIHNQLGKMGMKTDYGITSIDFPISEISQYPGLVNDMEALEATNEYDASGDTSWASKILAQQSALYQQTRGSTAMENVIVIAPSLAQPEYAAQLGDISAISDTGNSHAYFQGWNPNNPGAHINNTSYFLRLAEVNVPAKPTWVTETGFWTVEGQYWGGIGDGEQLSATYAPRVLLEFWLAGAQRTYVYELADESDITFFGLLRNDGTPKPAFYAVSNLLGLLDDPGPPITPGSLAYQLSGASPLVHEALFQKRDGSYYLALWVEAPGLDPATLAVSAVPSQTVQVILGQFPEGVISYQWNASGTMVTAALQASQSISVSIGPNLTILKIQ
jgi:hypothetical protein